MTRTPGTFLSELLMNLATGSPVLLAYVMGMILSLVYWRRCPRACLLCLLGTGLLLATTVGRALVFQYLVYKRIGLDPSSAVSFGTLIGVLSFVASVLGAVGLGLLLSAVFVGRRRQELPAPLPDLRRAEAARVRPGDPGITRPVRGGGLPGDG